MTIEKNKLDAFAKYSEANTGYLNNIRDVISGKQIIDQDKLKSEANALVKLFDEYRKAWNL